MTMPSQFIVTPIADADESSITVTACVGLVTVPAQANKFVLVNNKRGWDIPGGHVEPGEKPDETFRREVLEESGCNLLHATPIATLTSETRSGSGMLVYRAICEWNDFASTDEVSGTRLVTRDELLSLYFGDKELIGKLLMLAMK